MIWEMFDKKVFPQKMVLSFRVLWFVKRTDSKRTKKGAQTERERESVCVCVRETKRQRDDIDDDDEEDDLVVFVRAVPENGAHAGLL